jgi:hypothetical protein
MHFHRVIEAGSADSPKALWRRTQNRSLLGLRADEWNGTDGETHDGQAIDIRDRGAHPTSATAVTTLMGITTVIFAPCTETAGHPTRNTVSKSNDKERSHAKRANGGQSRTCARAGELGGVWFRACGGSGVDRTGLRSVRGCHGACGWIHADVRCPLHRAIAKDGSLLDTGWLGNSRRTALAPRRLCPQGGDPVADTRY